MDKQAKQQSRKSIRDALTRLRLAASNRADAVDVALDGPLQPISYPATATRDKAVDHPPPVRPKVPISIRLDADLVEALRASGRGWQSRVNAMLREAIGVDSALSEKFADHPQEDHGANDGDHERTDK